MVVFEVFVAPGADPSQILREETCRETQAQIMTLADAQKLGLRGVPDPGGKEVRLVLVKRQYLNWIHRSLEMSDAVAIFRVHELD
jgi:predicted Zn-dependent protease with MMP-like domain